MVYKKEIFNKYLELLKIEVAEPSFEFLKRIVKAHLIAVPFENISKLYYKQLGMNSIPDLPQYLEGIEKYNFGGTCYSNNFYLYLLLKHLGFKIKLCGADMKNPDVHLISMVNIDDHEFIVDAGYGAPFLEPMPRDLEQDYVIDFGYEKYILKPQNDKGISKLEQYYNGELRHWYVAKPESRKIEEFKKVIEDSYANSAMFMNAILITRFYENGSVVLRNLNLTETTGDKFLSKEILFEDIPKIINTKFGIPVHIVRKAISNLSELKNT